MVFQHFYLWPHMVALENVIEGLVSVKITCPSAQGVLRSAAPSTCAC
jgi:ABC-type histidine transport system ATPase subunit